MDEDHKFILCIVLFVVDLILVVICWLGFGVPKTVITIDSFAADSAGRVYIMSDNDIYVYENNRCVQTIDLHETLADVREAIVIRGSTHTVTPSDMILVHVDKYIFTLDLQGNLVSYVPFLSGKSPRIEPDNKKFYAFDGSVYTKKNPLGRTKIVRDDSEVVYQIPLQSLFMKIGMYLSICIFVYIFVTLLIMKISEWLWLNG